jgi:hypothetical protein
MIHNSNYREAAKNIEPIRLVIASEDDYACKHYLEIFKRGMLLDLNDDVFTVEFIEKSDFIGKKGSAPKILLQQILIRIGQHYKYADIEVPPKKQFWLIFDRDTWDVKQLNEVYQEVQAQQTKGVPLYAAMSNPCFAYWLYLHFAAPPDKPMTCSQLEKELQALGGLNKDNLKMLKGCYKAYSGETQGKAGLQQVSQAIDYAKEEVAEDQTFLDLAERSSGTHFYQLVEPLLIAAHTKLDWLHS